MCISGSQGQKGSLQLLRNGRFMDKKIYGRNGYFCLYRRAQINSKNSLRSTALETRILLKSEIIPFCLLSTQPSVSPIVGAQHDCLLNESKFQICSKNGILDIDREAANVPL